MQVPETQKMSPQSRSLVQLRATHSFIVGRRTQSNPEGQGVEPQRICSQRFVEALQVCPSRQGLFAEHPG